MMKASSAAQMLKEAETLKASLAETAPTSGEGWQKRQQLCQCLEDFLTTDLEYALDKRAEQDLWNFAFKNPISSLQIKAKDRKNPNHAQIQSQLSLLLEAASGFYLQLLQRLCSTYNIELPCCPEDVSLGFIENPKKTVYSSYKASVLYLCQDCLVHLGDVARYRGQSLQAETFYKHAAELVPSNGHPYNQLAILEAASGEKLSAVFFHIRSLAVHHPFPAAGTNLRNLFAKMSCDGVGKDGKSRMSAYEYCSTFLQFHALIHMGVDYQSAERLLCQLTTSLPALIIAEKLESWQLVQMVAVCLFAVEHAWGTLDFLSDPKKDDASSTCPSTPELLSEDEQRASALVLELMAGMLHAFLLPVHALLDPQESKEYYTLPAVKVILDWVLQNEKVLLTESFIRKPQIWHGFCKLLNDFQQQVESISDSLNAHEDVPLPEDWDLQCFLPLKKSHKKLKFNLYSEPLPEEELSLLRAKRLCAVGEKFHESDFNDAKFIKINVSDDGAKMYTASQQSEALSQQVLQQIQELTISSSSAGATSQHQSSEEAAKSGTGSIAIDHSSIVRVAKSPAVEGGSSPEVRFKLDEIKQRSEHGSDTSHEELYIESGKPEKKKHLAKDSPPMGREKRGGRQNVALQAILQQRAAKIGLDVLPTRESQDMAKETLVKGALTADLNLSCSSSLVPTDTGVSQASHGHRTSLDAMMGQKPTDPSLHWLSLGESMHQENHQVYYEQKNMPPNQQNLNPSLNVKPPWPYPPPSQQQQPPQPPQTQHSYTMPQQGNGPPPGAGMARPMPQNFLQSPSQPPHLLDVPFQHQRYNQPQQPDQQQQNPKPQPARHQQQPPSQQPYVNNSGMMWNYLGYYGPNPIQANPPVSAMQNNPFVLPSTAGHFPVTPAARQQQQQQQPPAPQQQHQQTPNYIFMNTPSQMSHVEGTPFLHGLRSSGSAPAGMMHHQVPSSSVVENQPDALKDQQQQQAMDQSAAGMFSRAMPPPVYNKSWQQDVWFMLMNDMSGKKAPPSSHPEYQLGHSASVRQQIPPHLINSGGGVNPNLSSANPHSMGSLPQPPQPPPSSSSSASQGLSTTNNPSSSNTTSDSTGNTYSLFNSPWPSTLTVSPSAAAPMREGNQTGTGTSRMDALMVQPRIQSLWSGTGTSALERLLEQQKQRRDNSGQGINQ